MNNFILMIWDCIIVGGGVTGISAAIYAYRFNMKVMILAKDLGGLLATTHIVENYPGYASISGPDLMEKFKEHARYFNIPMVEEFVKKVNKAKCGFEVKTESKTYKTKTIILATGTEHKKLENQKQNHSKNFLLRNVNFFPEFISDLKGEQTQVNGRRCEAGDPEIELVLPTSALFGIVQGGRDENLRKKSAKFIGGLDFDGFGIGGSFAKEDMSTAVKWVSGILPENKPRHLLGIGEPEDIFMGVENGVDLFDCVAPTRNARNGTLYTANGKINIMNAKYRNDFNPIEKDCGCYTCKNYSSAYIAHLFHGKEMLAATLATIHNLYFIIHLVKRIRQSILDENFFDFKKEFLQIYNRE